MSLVMATTTIEDPAVRSFYRGHFADEAAAQFVSRLLKSEVGDTGDGDRNACCLGSGGEQK